MLRPTPPRPKETTTNALSEVNSVSSTSHSHLQGRIHSVETCGTVDGPGIRFVIFTQGCLLRCQYCHNPDTRDLTGGKLVTVDELIDEIESTPV